MAKQRPAPAAESVPEHPLAEILERLTNELQLTRQTLDELRTDVQWAIQNCLTRSADECVSSVNDSAPENTPFNPLPTFEEGDAVTVNHNGQELFGEVTSIDDAENLAEVLLIPSNETMKVIQDKLSRIQPDSLRRLFPEPALCIVRDAAAAESVSIARPTSLGRLF